jgi:hypothetical protein
MRWVWPEGTRRLCCLSSLQVYINSLYNDNWKSLLKYERDWKLGTWETMIQIGAISVLQLPRELPSQIYLKRSVKILVEEETTAMYFV